MFWQFQKKTKHGHFRVYFKKLFSFQISLVSSQKFGFFDPKADNITTPLKWVGIFIKKKEGILALYVAGINTLRVSLSALFNNIYQHKL